MIQQADKMLQMGLIQSPAQYIRIAELPGSEHILAGISPQTHKARRENSELARGEISNPEWHREDTHEIHIEEHQAFMSTKRWELLPPELQQLFIDHVKMHRNFAAERQAKDIRMAGAQASAMQASAPVVEPGQAGPVGPPPPQPPSGSPQGQTPPMVGDQTITPNLQSPTDTLQMTPDEQIATMLGG